MNRLDFSSLIVSIVGVTLWSSPFAIALPFNPDSGSFERYVNAVWRQGGSNGIELDGALKSDNPQDRRLYHGFYGCKLTKPYSYGWSPTPASVKWDGGVLVPGDSFHYSRSETVEGYSCKGYVDRTTPAGSRRCETEISYNYIVWWKKYPGQDQFQDGSRKYVIQYGECKIYS